MPVKVQHFSTKQSILLAVALILLIPALLTNLGLIAFYDDEGIRALVAMEMQISGNYITPTMFGEFYYNKPPLYNWILLAVFEIFGRSDEFICRLVTVFFLLAFSGSVYTNFRKNLPPSRFPYLSLLASLALITCGRILFWDSMLGLIDLCFSWVMFLLFMVIYQEGEKQRYGRLFGHAYLLTGIGFMLKGLPAVVFLGLALLTYFIWQKKIKKLFSLLHVAGGLVFVAIVGSYYFLYSKQNGLEVVFNTLFNESAKRTFVEHGFGETVLHFFTFPFEMWWHFLPWTLLVVCFFSPPLAPPKGRGRLSFGSNLLKGTENKFITWNLLVFLVTVLPYWSSVEVYPRYLFMYVPLVFSGLFYFYIKNKKEGGALAKTVEMIFFSATCMAVVAALLPMALEVVQDVPFLYLKSIGIAAAMAVLALLFWQWKEHRMLVFVLVLLVARIGFNWFVLPSRLTVECSTNVRASTLEAVEKAAGQPIYIYKNSLGFQPMTGYYFSRETGRILTRQHEGIDSAAYYLIDPTLYDPRPFDKIMNVKIKWECGELIFGKLKK